MISVVMLAYQEEEQLPETLDQVIKFADEIIVVDSYSEDQTADIAESYGAKVYQRKWRGYADAWNYGFEHASGDWILQLGADEVPSDELVKYLSEFDQHEHEVDGYKIHSINYVFGNSLPHWSRYAPRLFKASKGRMTERRVHEHLKIDGNWGKIEMPLYHFTYDNVSEYLEKLSRYTRLEAEEFDSKPSLFKTYIYPLYTILNLLIRKRLILDGADGVFIALMSGVYEYVAAHRGRLRFKNRPYE